MHSTIRNTMRAALVAAFGAIGLANAHDGHGHGGARHGGVEAKTERHHFEAVFTKQGVALYVYDASHKPVDASSLKATATFYHPNAPDKAWFSRDLAAVQAKPGQPSDSLTLPIDLSKAPEKGLKASFQVSGFDDASEREANVSVPVSFAGALVVTASTAADAQAIAQLKLCPVSREELGSMGTPLKVARDGQATYLCCKGCLKKVQAEPDKFLGAKAPPTGGDAHHDHAH